MKRWFLILGSFIAASAGPAVSLAQSAATPSDDAVLYAPSYVPWVHTVILAITWLFVAAILLGPIVLKIQEARSTRAHLPMRRRAR